MTTYLTDKHGQRWALVPVEPSEAMAKAGCYRYCSEFVKDYTKMLAAAPDFEPREVSDEELDAVIPPLIRWHIAGRSPYVVAAVRQAMRAAMALWSTT